MHNTNRHSNLPLLNIQSFGSIAKILAKKAIWYEAGPGNAGDELLHAGAMCLFRKIETRIVSKAVRPDFIVWGGGGNLGSMWMNCFRRRARVFQEAKEREIPIIIMPQSATDTTELFNESVHIFARESTTQKLYPQSTLAPDTSLAFDEDVNEFSNKVPLFNVGVFLRKDKESSGLFDLKLSIGDPTSFSKDHWGYFRLASEFACIVTDRLHFAITALILGRRTVLLQNIYYKNQAVYDAWLRSLNCLWGVDEMQNILRADNYNPEQSRMYCNNFLLPK